MHFHWPELPVADPVLYFAIATTIFLIVPVLFERLGVPGLIGLIVVGAVVGPNGVGILARDQVTVFLGTLGLLYLMLLVGLELDLNEFRRHRKQSLLFGVASFVLPQGIGTAVGFALGFELEASLLLGAVFASHTLVAYPIASRLGIIKTPAVTTVLGGTLITDVFALLVLAVVVGAATGDGEIGWWFWVRLLSQIGGFAVVVLVILPRLARWFFRQLGGRMPLDFAFTIAALFGTCFVAEFAGVEPIIGALLCGLALNRFVPEQSTLMARIQFSADTLFVPFFLLSVGMLVDVRSFANPAEWSVILLLTGGVLLAKAAAAFLVSRVVGYRTEDGWLLFGLSVTHAASTMAIVLVGYEVGFFGLPVVNAVVVMVLATCLVGPWATAKWGRVVALREERAPIASGHGPTRILIPISHPRSRDGLIDLGLMLRPKASDEPLLPIMVVPDDGAGSEAHVAEAERMLSHAVLRASAASAPVTALARVDQNAASGIGRAVAETRASMLVIGWDGGHSAVSPNAVFGSVLDQLLEITRTQVLVASLTRPLNAVNRIVLILPTFANRHPGFGAVAQTFSTLSQQLAAPIHAMVVGDKSAPFEKHIQALKPAPSIAFVEVPSWRQLESEVEADVRADDLIILMNARQGTLPWHPRLERLPRWLSSIKLSATGGVPPLLIVYPPEVTGEESAAVRRTTELPHYLDSRRIVSNLPRLPYERALERLLLTEYGDRPVQRDAILASLVPTLIEDGAELRPGVSLPHVRVPGITHSLVFLGLSPEGIEFPHSTEPARVIFLLISPRESPEEHLRALAEIAGLCSDEARINELLSSYGVEPLA